MIAMIEIEELRKSYGEVFAVDGISVTARAGEIFGLLGPNGAGKTTTVGCICGLLTPSAGRVKVGGHDVMRDGAAARAQLGMVPQELALYDDLSARENLAYWAGAQGLRNPKLRERIQQVLELAGLEDRAREPVKRFSGGIKRRLNFACGIPAFSQSRARAFTDGTFVQRQELEPEMLYNALQRTASDTGPEAPRSLIVPSATECVVR